MRRCGLSRGTILLFIFSANQLLDGWPRPRFLLGHREIACLLLSRLPVHSLVEHVISNDQRWRWCANINCMFNIHRQIDLIWAIFECVWEITAMTGRTSSFFIDIWIDVVLTPIHSWQKRAPACSTDTKTKQKTMEYLTWVGFASNYTIMKIHKFCVLSHMHTHTDPLISQFILI